MKKTNLVLLERRSHPEQPWEAAIRRAVGAWLRRALAR